MALIFDSATRTSLNGASTKINWAQLLGTALGNSRRIRCFRDSNASAANPFLTGTEFRNVGSAGAITTVAGKIKKFGQIKGGTISLAADMSTGASILRIEGNGKFIQGTLGLSAAAQIANGVAAGAVVQYDFTVRNSFTAINGFAFTPNFGISGNRFLPSGTGPAAPALDANAPHIFEAWNWTNPAAPFLSGSMVLNNRIDDFVLEDAERASEIGDIAVYQSTQSVMHGVTDVVEFGFTLLASHQGNTEVGNLPLYEVIGGASPRGTWTTYPQSDTFNPATHVMFPEPFKVVMKNAAGVVLYTWQMANGDPINGVNAFEGSRTLTAALRPNWDCGQQLPWENTPQKMSVKATKYYPGLTDDAKRPSRAKRHDTFNGVEPLITGGYNGYSLNGIHNLYATVERPQPKRPYPAIGAVDPWLSSDFTFNGGSADASPWASGYGWEPGSYSLHNKYTGPGGTRQDRAAIASIFALWLTDPNGSRLQGNIPWKTMALSYAKGYHNHSNHWVADPKTLMLPADYLSYKFIGQYYGDAPGGARAKVIDLRGNGLNADPMEAQTKDKYGRLFWGGWLRDQLHSYTFAGQAGVFINSPRAIIAHKWDAMFQLCSEDGSGNFRLDYMVRSQAWLWMCFVWSWKVASTHPLGISREVIEQKFIAHIERLYTDVYVPTFVNNEQSIFCDGLRNLGVPGFLKSGNFPGIQGGGLGYYMTWALALMKQTGLWSRLYGMGGHIKDVLDMQLRNMDKYCFEKILYTKSSQYLAGGYQEWTFGSPVPTSWANWSATYEGGTAQTGLFHNDAGVVIGDRDVSVHPMAAYPYMRRDFFPEFPHPLLTQAIAKYDSEYGAVTDHVAAGSTPAVQRDRDHKVGYPGISFFKAPLELGPA